MLIDIATSFFAGVVTFVAPCTLPLIPAYLGFIGGTKGLSIRSDRPAARQLSLLIHAAMFVLGFSLIFMFYGLISGVLGGYFVAHRFSFSRVSGALIIFFGLAFLGLLPAERIFRGTFRALPSFVSVGTLPASLLLGVLFGVGWTPCLGPVLGTILVLAASQGEALYGTLLLAIYSLGIGIPFILLAIVFDHASTSFGLLTKYVPYVARVGAVLLIIFGFSLLFPDMFSMGHWMDGISFHALS